MQKSQRKERSWYDVVGLVAVIIALVFLLVGLPLLFFYIFFGKYLQPSG